MAEFKSLDRSGEVAIQVSSRSETISEPIGRMAKTWEDGTLKYRTVHSKRLIRVIGIRS